MHIQDVRFDSDGCALAGTYLQVAQPVAVALLLPGSGKADRDSDTPSLKIGLTRTIAEALALIRVSTLRYDKRGIGASTGDHLRSGLADHLADARAALDWLTARAPGLPLLVIGHSEGALLAADVAGHDQVAGVALLSMAARRGDDTLTWQTRMLATRLPRATQLILRLAHIDVIRTQRKNMERVRASTADVIRIQGVRLNARWLREFMAHDPRPALAGIAVPVLAITGAHDLQVPPTDIDVMRETIPGPFDGHIVDDLSHLWRPDPDRIGPRGYRKAVRQRTSLEPLALITDWIIRNWHQP